MKPLICLGSGDSPEFEISRYDLYPIFAAMMDVCAPLEQDVSDALWDMYYLDTAHLDASSVKFFQCMETVCQLISSGELKEFDMLPAQNSEFAGDLLRFVKVNTFRDSTVQAAHDFLKFLQDHPEYWPFQEPTKSVISLAPGVNPEFEISHEDLYPIFAALMDVCAPLEQGFVGSLSNMFYFDKANLNAHSAKFFQCMEKVCQLISSGELKEFDMLPAQNSEFAEGLLRYVKVNTFSDSTVQAAHDFLTFLQDHPEYWPFRKTDG